LSDGIESNEKNLLYFKGNKSQNEETTHRTPLILHEGLISRISKELKN
jgi:hypothetical protein